jgi:hypothetical protein
MQMEVPMAIDVIGSQSRRGKAFELRIDLGVCLALQFGREVESHAKPKGVAEESTVGADQVRYFIWW